MHGKLIGVDFGSKRVGIALSDEGGRMAFPQCTLENNADLVENVATLCKAELVGGVVLGRSIDSKGRLNPIMESAKAFKAALEEELSIPIEYQDEYMTSHHAAQSQERVKDIDASAAALILQRYLDKNNED